MKREEEKKKQPVRISWNSRSSSKRASNIIFFLFHSIHFSQGLLFTGRKQEEEDLSFFLFLIEGEQTPICYLYRFRMGKAGEKTFFPTTVFHPAGPRMIT